MREDEVKAKKPDRRAQWSREAEVKHWLGVIHQFTPPPPPVSPKSTSLLKKLRRKSRAPTDRYLRGEAQLELLMSVCEEVMLES